MNDRFKFRVWDKYLKGYVKENLGEKYVWIEDDGQLGAGIDDDDCILEQCTGLKDKNGKLIFEGDIIHEVDKGADIDDVSQIVWNQETCHFMKLDLPDTKLNRRCLLCEADSPYIEIIGNIHEQAEQKDK